MRTLIFRGLAGLVAVSIILVLVFGDLAKQPLPQLIGTIVVALVFGVFALFGTEPAERLAVMVFGGEYPEKPSVGPSSGNDTPA